MIGNGFMLVLAIFLVLGNASLVIIFDMIREKVKYKTSRLSEEIGKLCIIGIAISMVTMNVGVIILAQFLHL